MNETILTIWSTFWVTLWIVDIVESKSDSPIGTFIATITIVTVPWLIWY